DIFGTRGEGSEQIFMQTALTITSPISGTVSFLPGTSTLHLGAACADRGGCTLSVLTPGGWITAGDRLDVDLPVPAPPFHDAGQYLFDFYATGPAPVFFEAFFRVPIYLEDTTPNLSELVAVNGPVVDYDGGRVLHVLHPRSDPVHDPLGIYDLAALTDVSIGDPDLGPYTVSWSRRVARLTPFGAVFLYELNETMPPYFTRALFEWNGSQFVELDPRVFPDPLLSDCSPYCAGFAAWNSGTTVMLFDSADESVTAVGTGVVSAVTASGKVVYSAGDDVFSYEGGTTTQITHSSPLISSGARTDGTNYVFQRRDASSG